MTLTLRLCVHVPNLNLVSFLDVYVVKCKCKTINAARCLSDGSGMLQQEEPIQPSNLHSATLCLQDCTEHKHTEDTLYYTEHNTNNGMTYKVCTACNGHESGLATPLEHPQLCARASRNAL